MWLITCKKCTTKMQEGNNTGIWEISVLPTQTFCKSKAVLKNKVS